MCAVITTMYPYNIANLVFVELNGHCSFQLLQPNSSSKRTRCPRRLIQALGDKSVNVAKSAIAFDADLAARVFELLVTLRR